MRLGAGKLLSPGCRAGVKWMYFRCTRFSFSRCGSSRCVAVSRRAPTSSAQATVHGQAACSCFTLRYFRFLLCAQVVTSTVEATCRTAAAGDTEAQAGQPGACRWDAFTATTAVWSCTLGFARSAFRRMVAVMPLKRDAPRFRRALRNSLAITASGCLAVAVDRWLLGSQGYSFWAPTTVALIVARGMDAPTYSSVRERLVVS